MVIGILVVAGIPTTIGVCEALSAQKKANAAAKEKAKFHLTVTVSLDGRGPVECWCVLKDGKLWIDHPSFPVAGHKFTGYYFTYPSGAQERQQQQQKPHLGLVSTVADDPPMLNWIFVDKDSGVVRHGGRQDTLGGHTTGPWYWSDDEQWLTLGGDAGRFVAVQLEGKKWAVAWDHGAGEEGEERNFGGRGGRREPLVGEGEGEGEGECDGSGTELGTETEQTGHQNGELEGSRLPASRRLPRKWVPVMLRRKMQLGMESRYVKGENG